MQDAGLEHLNTERLQLRRFTPQDIGFLQQLYSDEEVARHIGGLRTRQQCQEMLDQHILAYYGANPGLGIWMTLDRHSGEPMGMHLLNHMRGETLIQVGYSLLRRHWGRGYATEMCRALLRYGFGDLGLPRIHAITSLENLASQQVLLKCGLQRKGERNFAAYAQHGPQAYFECDAADWRAQNLR